MELGYQRLPIVDGNVISNKSQNNYCPSTVSTNQNIYEPKSDNDIIHEINMSTFKIILSIIVLSLIFGPIYVLFINDSFSAKTKKVLRTDSFNLYVLAYSWQPEFCDNMDYIGCTKPDVYWKQHFTLHGLWPQYATNGYPSFCSEEIFDTKIPNLIGINLFKRYWPNVKYPTTDNRYDQLWEHEWAKHGTCSGLSQYNYFNQTINLIQKFGTPDYIRTKLNNYANATLLRQVFGGNKMVSLQCVTHKPKIKRDLSTTISKNYQIRNNGYNNNQYITIAQVTNLRNQSSHLSFSDTKISEVRENIRESIDTIHTTTKNIDSSNSMRLSQSKSYLTYYLEGVYTCWSQVNGIPRQQVICPQEVLQEDNCHDDKIFIKSFS